MLCAVILPVKQFISFDALNVSTPSIVPLLSAKFIVPLVAIVIVLAPAEPNSTFAMLLVPALEFGMFKNAPCNPVVAITLPADTFAVEVIFPTASTVPPCVTAKLGALLLEPKPRLPIWKSPFALNFIILIYDVVTSPSL